MVNNPESTIAQSFAADLDDMFGLAPSDAPRRQAPSSVDDPVLNTAGVTGLVEQVDQKKQALNSKDAELQALEAKLREAEERLARVSRNASPARASQIPAQAQASVGASDYAPAPTSAPANLPPQSVPQNAAQSLAQKSEHLSDRPAANRGETQQLMSRMPGYMPPETPGEAQVGSGRSSEYVMIENEQARR